MSTAHKSSILPIRNVVVPVDYDSAHFSFDNGFHGVDNGDLIFPSTTPIATLRNGEGKYGGAASIDAATTNIWTTNLLAPHGCYLTLTDKVHGGPVYLCEVRYPDAGNNWGMTIHASLVLPTQGTSLKLTISLAFYIESYTSTASVSPHGYIVVTYSDATTQQFGFNGVPNFLDKSNWGKWINWSNTFTTSSTKTATSITNCYFYADSVTSSKVYLRAPQIEQLAYPTSFVDGSRGNPILAYPSSLFSVAEGTFSEWIYVRDDAAHVSSPYWGFGMSIVDNAAGEPNQISIRRTPGSNNEWYVRMTDNTGSGQATMFGNPVPTGWHMFTFTWRKSTNTVTAYLDGNQTDKNTSAKMPDSFVASCDGYCRIGNWLVDSSSDYCLNSMVDDVYILQREATPDEIRAWYQSSAPLYNPYDTYGVVG